MLEQTSRRLGLDTPRVPPQGPYLLRCVAGRVYCSGPTLVEGLPAASQPDPCKNPWSLDPLAPPFFLVLWFGEETVKSAPADSDWCSWWWWTAHTAEGDRPFGEEQATTRTGSQSRLTRAEIKVRSGQVRVQVEVEVEVWSSQAQGPTKFGGQHHHHRHRCQSINRSSSQSINQSPSSHYCPPPALSFSHIPIHQTRGPRPVRYGSCPFQGLFICRPPSISHVTFKRQAVETKRGTQDIRQTETSSSISAGLLDACPPRLGPYCTRCTTPLTPTLSHTTHTIHTTHDSIDT